MTQQNERAGGRDFIATAVRNIILALSFIFAATGLASAADALAQPQPPVQDQQRWRVIVSPYLWGASLKGDVGLFGRSTDVDMPFRKIFDNLDAGVMGNIEIGNGVFGAYVDGQYVKTSQDADIRRHELDLDVTTTVVAGGVFYRLYDQPLEGATLFGDRRTFAIEPTAGLRWTRIKAGIDIDRFGLSRKVEWTDPFVGARVLYDIDDRWNLAAEADVGGFGAGTKLSANGQIYLGYRMRVFEVPTMLRIGYRALYQDYDRDDSRDRFKYNVTQHGPVIGFSVVF